MLIDSAFCLWPPNNGRQCAPEFPRFSGHPDLTNQEIHNAQTRPQNDL